MKTILQKTNAFILSIILMCSVFPIEVNAAYEIPKTCQVQTDVGATNIVKTLDYSYDYNTYFSLRDIAMILKDTEKNFSLDITKNAVALNIGNAYIPVDTENIPWENSENPDIPLRRNEFKVNGQKVSYYTMIMMLPSGGYDCFMMAVDLAMLLDMDITVARAGVLQFNTQSSFSISPAILQQTGYFYGVNSVLVGDATTGEVFYQYQSDTSFPIASTSKLMTCLLTMDAIAGGQISLEQTVAVSEAVEALSGSSDGVIPFEAGQQITVQELLVGALLPSSNECALCLAETIAGSEEAFVQLMNQKALELGLSQAVFFNSNGLPSFTEDPIPAKRQNRMSAKDMFRLVSYLLKVYPQVKDITSMEETTLQSLNLEVKNTNPLLRNMPEVTGLKTGTTNKSGACLVSSLIVDDGTIQHDLVVIVLGTEDSIERGRVSALLARYALQTFDTNIEEVNNDSISGYLPTHAEAAVDWVLQTAKSAINPS
ncbi:D-alanyl-D-alanine carboxypeptidase DacF [Lachnospiraceae bacterium]|nr:D-alanyl-D-alanine carboxypeptidase DacF [Lachnospiraceae bacterium]